MHWVRERRSEKTAEAVRVSTNPRGRLLFDMPIESSESEPTPRRVAEKVRSMTELNISAVNFWALRK